MRSLRFYIVAALILGVVSPAFSSEGSGGVLAGRVVNEETPMPTARIYAYELAGLSLRKVVSDREGIFFFDELPAGLYKIIAFKPGFMPAVEILTRTTAEAAQFIEMRLNEPGDDPRAVEAEFWRVREQIPTDVLRDIQQVAFATAGAAPTAAPGGPAFETEMTALSGVQEGLEFGSAQLNGAQLGIRGQLRDMTIGFRGRYAQLEGRDFPVSLQQTDGSSQSVSVEVSNRDRAKVGWTSHSNRMVSLHGNQPTNVDFEQHRISWSQAVGEKGRSAFSAQYVEENNFYRQALIGPDWIPEASRTWNVEGSYATQIADRANIHTGMRYRERQVSTTDLGQHPILPRESVEIFGKGDWAVKPAVAVQYGLYATSRDGTLSLAPQGGAVVRFGPNWEASTLASVRLQTDDDVEAFRDFLPAYYRDSRDCGERETYCYQLELVRSLADDGKLSVGAVHRKIGETQRLYFDDDFFDRFDSVYLVDGDRLPELQFEFTRRLGPAVLASLQSYLAAGGGGLLTPLGDQAYENEVRYLVTALDTQLEGTATGIYLAFHRLEQALNPLVAERNDRATEMALERLHLGVTQDLSFLDSLAADLAVQLNMELSRGGSSEVPTATLDELRKRVTGGVAVRF